MFDFRSCEKISEHISPNFMNPWTLKKTSIKKRKMNRNKLSFGLTLMVVIISVISCNKKAIDKPVIAKITPEKLEKIKDTISRKTLIHFWFSYCHPCIKEIPELNKFVKDEKLQLIHISSDKSDSKMQENLEKVMTKSNINQCYIIDFKNLYPNGTKFINIMGDFSRKIGLKEAGSPYYVVINENGKIEMESHELKKIKEYIK